MTLYLDSADLNQIDRLAQTGVLAGLTMNPKLMYAHTDDPLGHLTRVLQATDGIPVTYQPTKAYGNVLDEALRAHELGPQNVVLKIPVIRSELPLAAMLVRRGISVALTAALSPVHMMVAESIGARHIIPYVDRASGDIRASPELVRELAQVRSGAVTIVAASLKTVGQALRARMDGADVVSVPAAVIDAMLDHPMSMAAGTSFDGIYLPNQLSGDMAG